MENSALGQAQETAEMTEVIADTVETEVIIGGEPEGPDQNQPTWFETKKAQFYEWMKKYEDFPKPLRRNKYKFIFCMLILSIVSWAVFYVYKNLSSFTMAFQILEGYGEGGKEIYRWGFDNFVKFWTEMTTVDKTMTSFKNALMNTLFLYVAGNVLAIPLEYLTSYYLYKKITGYKVFRNVFYLPNILSAVVMTTIFKNIVAADGLISHLYLSMNPGITPAELTSHWVTKLLSTKQYAKWTVLLYLEWVGLPGSYIVLTAAMNRIPTSVTESAKLDGVSAWGEFRNIVIPMIWPTIYILILSKITGILSADGPILLLTNGAHDTYTIGFWFYSQIIVSHSFEYPSAIGLIMTAVVAPISIIARKLLDKVYADVEY